MYECKYIYICMYCCSMYLYLSICMYILYICKYVCMYVLVQKRIQTWIGHIRNIVK